MQKDQKKFADAGIRVVGISYDAVDVLAKFAKNKEITFLLLSDPDSKTIEAYGLRSKDAKGKSDGVPYPGTMIVGKDGKIKAKLFLEGVFKRNTTDDIVRAATGK